MKLALPAILCIYHPEKILFSGLIMILFSFSTQLAQNSVSLLTEKAILLMSLLYYTISTFNLQLETQTIKFPSWTHRHSWCSINWGLRIHTCSNKKQKSKASSGQLCMFLLWCRVVMEVVIDDVIWMWFITYACQTILMTYWMNFFLYLWLVKTGYITKNNSH